MWADVADVARPQNLVDFPTQPIFWEVMKCRIEASVSTLSMPKARMCRAKLGTLNAIASPQPHREGFILLVTKEAT